MPFLAKSSAQGGLSLLDHTRHVLSAIESMADGFGLSGDERRVARLGAILHDLGKAHPYFQAMVGGTLTRAQVDANRDDPHRHELSSLLLLPAFDRADWPALVELVAAHHKSIRADAGASATARKGLLDLCHPASWTCLTHGWPLRDSPDEVFERHAQGFDTWGPQVLAEVAAPLLGAAPEPVTREAAREAFGFALDHAAACHLPGWSARKGVLIAADHFASHFMGRTEAEARRLFAVPPEAAFAGESPLYPLSMRPVRGLARHTLVVAPTGAGKTNYLMRRCQGRVFYTLPFQASINAMADRMRKAYGNDADVRRVHAASKVTMERSGGEDTREDVDLQRFPGAMVKVMTPHQLAALAFGTSGHEPLALDVAGHDVILDEVHVYGGFVLAMVVAIVRALVRLGCRVHIGTATIPDAIRALLVEALGGADAVHVERLRDDELVTFNRHTVHRLDPADETAVIEHALGRGERVLVVRNRVDRAQATFRDARTRWPDVPVTLVHSRFQRGERSRLERSIYTLAEGPGPCLVVTTQVVEVSLDVSFDRLITEAAPLDALVQRFGRVNRKRPAPEMRPVHILTPPETRGDALPYDLAVVQASVDALPDDGEVLDERSVQARLDRVYPAAEVEDISLHLLHDGDAFRLNALQHRPKQFFLDRLAIDALSVIRASDEATYAEARAVERTKLEIPVPLSSLFRHLRSGTVSGRVKAGAWPFVVPDDWYDRDEGLTIPRAEGTPPPTCIPLDLRMI